MPDQLQEFFNIAELEELKRVNNTLLKQLKRSNNRNEGLVEATLQGAKAAMISVGRVPPVKLPKLDKRKTKEEIALWHLTDWQGSKVTTSYNSIVMRDRLMSFCDTAYVITEMQRADHPVKECIVLLGGDLIEGLFNYPTQPYEIDATIFEQYTIASRLVVDILRKCLSIYDKVLVKAKWGNHGRIGAKRSVVPASDNFDRMIYHLARELLINETRLEWQDSIDEIQRFEKGNYSAILIHGDEIGRNGYASPMTIVNHVSKWKSGAYPLPFKDCYLGHYHNHQEWQLPDGEGSVYMTGAPESDNRYARTLMAAAARPTQRLHFISPSRGHVTSQHKVYLDG